MSRPGLLRSVGVISGATLVSRIVGYLRDMLLAYYLGAGVVADAFFVAHRIPNFLRRLFGEGTLTAAFIPVLTERITKGEEAAARALIRRLTGLLLVASTLLTVAGVAAAPWLVRIMAPGFTREPAKLHLAVELTRLMFPYALFLAVAALAMGVLQAHRRFLWPALAPAAYNVAIITVAVLFADRWLSPVRAISLGVVVGGLAQLLIQLPAVRRVGYRLRPAWHPRDPAVRRVVRLMGPGILGLAILQVNILISTLLASFLPDGAVSYLYYANRVMEFPLGLFGIAIATAALPELADHAARDDTAGLIQALRRALQLCLLVMIPAGVGMAVLGRPIITLLFASGAFTEADVAGTRGALVAFAAGVWAYATVKVTIQAMYAQQDTATPMKTGAVTVVVDVALSLLLMGPLAHAGLALATSLAAAFQFGLLMLLLRRRLGPLGGRAILATTGRALVASGVMALACWGADTRWGGGPGRLAALAELALLIPAAVAVYGATLLLLGGEERRWLRQLWHRG